MKLVKAMTVGAIGGGLVRYKLGNQVLDIFGMTSLPAWAVMAAVLMTGSIISEYSHDLIFPHIDFLDKMSEPASAVLSTGVSSASALGTLYLDDARLINEIGLYTIIGCAVGSEVVGDYVYRKFLHGDE